MAVAPAGYAIAAAAPDSVALLPAIERAAAALFPDEDIPPDLRDDGFEVAELAEAAREERLFIALHVASGQTVGFAVAEEIDGSAHLEELDVLPEHGRRGLGTALVRTVADWARARGDGSLTLTTFRHLAWNAPFYARLGFEEIPARDRGPELAGLLAQEAQDGLDPARRVAMRLDLAASG